MSADETLRLQDVPPHVYRRLCEVVVQVVGRSFKEDKARGEHVVLTQHEIRRRTSMCARILRDMDEVQETGRRYSWMRMEDELPRALRYKLDNPGKHWEPPEKKRSMWAPARSIIMPGDEDFHV